MPFKKVGCEVNIFYIEIDVLEKKYEGLRMNDTYFKPSRSRLELDK